jgi:hypothetical protein
MCPTKNTAQNDEKIDIREELAEMIRAEVKKEIGNRPSNILQVICVTPHDNYLDMLADKTGSFDAAIEYIKDCALGALSGDCKLIEKIYLDLGQQSICFMDKKKTRVRYYDEHEKPVTESKESLTRKLTNNLQNTYLKGINYLINRNLESRSHPCKFLETYDMMAWNEHIQKLMEPSYQNKLLNNIAIPFI